MPAMTSVTNKWIFEALTETTSFGEHPETGKIVIKFFIYILVSFVEDVSLVALIDFANDVAVKFSDYFCDVIFIGVVLKGEAIECV